ncbi:MAG: MoaD/ThiS family protein [Deltaproteobacteria bacterium]|nr:MoaD/ThiS family protein [Deltaproteobacteria bacterium]
MGIHVNIHRTHRQFTQGRDRIEVQGRTVGECLDALIDQYPGIANVLFYKYGGLRNHVEIYLNADSAYPDELKKPVSDGDEITITALLAGG